MAQPYMTNALIDKSVEMLQGASAEYTSLSINVQYVKNRASTILTQPHQVTLF